MGIEVGKNYKYLGGLGDCTFKQDCIYRVNSIVKPTNEVVVDGEPVDRIQFSLCFELVEDRSLHNLPNPANDFKEICKSMIETFVKKNHDYGNSFDISCDEEGLAAARIRMGDKWLRFKQLSKGNEALVKDESIRDTLLDMANYCVMTVMWMDKKSGE